MLAEVLPSKKEEFKNEYGKRTGENAVEQKGFFVRRPGPTAWGVAYRIFFEPKVDWVIESFEKMGYHVTSNNVFSPYEDIKFPFLISNEELFWWLVDYGYKLGDNEPIQFSEYEERINEESRQAESAEQDEPGDDSDGTESETEG